jgi:hypothetical protein
LWNTAAAAAAAAVSLPLLELNEVISGKCCPVRVSKELVVDNVCVAGSDDSTIGDDDILEGGGPTTGLRSTLIADDADRDLLWKR